MAIYYWDPSTSNLGGVSTPNTFANRYYPLSAISSFISAGDTIRLVSSPDPVDMGQQATWTNQSLTVTLASAVTANVYTDGAWTAATNVTCTADSTNKKEGTNCASMAIASGFTTGKVAYFPVSNLDLRNFNTLNAWIRTSIANSSVQLAIQLCSDSTGDVPIDASNASVYAQSTAANVWSAVNRDPAAGGSNNNIWMPSGVNSVALYANSDPGTMTILVDNIFVSYPASGQSLSINSLIAPSASGPWYPIKSINGTTVTLDNHTNSLQGQGRGYWGPSGTYQLWKREVMPRCTNVSSNFPFTFSTGSLNLTFSAPTAATTVMNNYTGVAGTSGNPVTISGGWSFGSSMSVQDGETWLNPYGTGIGNLFGDLSTRSFVNFEKINFVRGNTFATFNAGNDDLTLTDCSSIGCTASPALGPISGMDRTSFINCYAGNNQTIGFGTAANATNQGLIVRGLRSYNNGGIGFNSAIGTAFAQGYTEISDVEVANNGGAQGFLLQNPCKLINNIRAYDNAVTSANAGIQLVNQSHIAFNLTSSGHTTAGAGGILVNSDNPRLYNAYTVGNNRGIYIGTSNQSIDSKVNLYNYSSSGNTVDFTFSSVNANTGWVNSMGAGGVPTANTSTSGYGVVSTDTSVTHSGTYSWRMAPGTTTQATQYAPLDHIIGRIPCNANRTITIKYWAQRSSTNLTAQMRIIGGIIPGVGSVGVDVTTSIDGSAGSWAQYTISCTPTIDCVLEVVAEAYITSGSGHFVYFDGAVEVT